jgi:hypothetical protein
MKFKVNQDNKDLQEKPPVHEHQELAVRDLEMVKKRNGL